MVSKLMTDLKTTAKSIVIMNRNLYLFINSELINGELSPENISQAWLRRNLNLSLGMRMNEIILVLDR